MWHLSTYLDRELDFLTITITGKVMMELPWIPYRACHRSSLP